jgi:hypothetical protein
MAETDVVDAAPKRPQEKTGREPCPECGAKRHTAGTTCPRARPPAPDRPPRRRKQPLQRDKVALGVGAALAAAQSLILSLRPDFAEDALNDQEFKALSYALADEVLASERLTNLALRLSKSGPHVNLAVTVAMIALPRLQRHGLIPAISVAPQNGAVPRESEPIPETEAVHSVSFDVVAGTE